MIVLLALLGTAQAQDGGYDGHGRHLAASDGDPLDPLWGFRSEKQLKGAFGASAALQWAESPLVRMTTDGDSETRDVLVDNALSLDIGGQYALHERIAVGLAVPVFFTTANVNGVSGPALGDARVSVPIGLVVPHEDGSGLGISAVPLLDLPSGAQGRWLGDNGPGAGAVLAVSHGAGKLHINGNIGAMTTAKVDALNLAGGVSLLSTLGVGYAIQPTTVARIEGRFDPLFNSNDVAWAAAPAELLASVRHRPEEDGIGFTGGVSTGLNRGASAAIYRIFLGINYTGNKHWPEPDTDGDGIVDSADACVTEPETVNNYKDVDGCPDALGNVDVSVTGPDGGIAEATLVSGTMEIGRTDASGKLALSGLMPETNLSLLAKHPAHAPSEAKSLTIVEGPQSAAFELEWLPGTLQVSAVDASTGEAVAANIRLRGVDEPAEVADGVATWTLAPSEQLVYAEAEGFGAVSQKVTLKPGETTKITLKLSPSKVEVQRESIDILEQVFFDFDKATIKAESNTLLNEIAATLTAHPEIERVEVQGHTDSDGADDYNLDLSQRRVDAVVAYLVNKGVESERLTPKGYGEAEPLVPNTSDANKAKNRRVNFVITQRAEK